VQPKGFIDATIVYGYSPSHELDPDRSLRILQKTVNENPGIVRECYYLGREYTYKKNWGAAIYWLTEYVENRATWAPEWADGYYILATAYRAVGKLDEAKNACLMALKINMDFKAAALLMAGLSGPINAAKWNRIANMATNERVLFTRSPVEKGADYYDKLFAHSSDMSRYEKIHRVVGNWTFKQNCLDIGCGTAELQNHVQYYHGIDFSAEAVKIANNKQVTQADIYTADLEGFETYIICEVLEHIDDQKMMARIPKDKNIIISVPSFTDPSHVRTYDEESMKDRLGKFMSFDEIIRFNWHGKWVPGGEDTASYILLARGRTN
jgi:predicted TPR repeat methyltransferase